MGIVAHGAACRNGLLTRGAVTAVDRMQNHQAVAMWSSRGRARLLLAGGLLILQGRVVMQVRTPASPVPKLPEAQCYHCAVGWTPFATTPAVKCPSDRAAKASMEG